MKGMRSCLLSAALAAASVASAAAAPLGSEAMRDLLRLAGDDAARAVVVPAVAAAQPAAGPSLGERFKGLQEGVVAILAGGPGGTINGTGFVIENGPEGLFLLTNAHVVGRESKVGVAFRFAGLAPHEGEVVGVARLMDVALVRVDAARLGQQAKLSKVPVLKLGDSGALRFRDEVVAVGHPLRTPFVVTFGRASHDGAVLDDQIPYIRYDGHLGPGNSGGPLFNMAGEVVGINTAMLQAPAQGVCFAVPINVVRSSVLAQLRRGKGPADERMRYGSLGVRLQPLTPELMLFLGLDTYAGAIVTRVTPEAAGFARGSGLKRGDVVLGVDGAREEGANAIQSRTAFSSWDLGDPEGLGNALSYDVVPEQLIREGKGSDPASRWRMSLFPQRLTQAELQVPGPARAADPPATDFDGTEGEHLGMYVLGSKAGLWVRVARGKGEEMRRVYLREVALKNGDGTVAFHPVPSVDGLKALARRAEAGGAREVLAVVSGEREYTPNSAVDYVLVSQAVRNP